MTVGYSSKIDGEMRTQLHMGLISEQMHRLLQCGMIMRKTSLIIQKKILHRDTVRMLLTFTGLMTTPALGSGLDESWESETDCKIGTYKARITSILHILLLQSSTPTATSVAVEREK